MNLWLYIILLCLWSVTDKVASAPGYKLKLVSGQENYGFVEMSITGFFQDGYHSICPSRNQKYTDLIGRVICQELGYLDGVNIDMKADSPSSQFWYNSFDVFSDFNTKTLMPNIAAYSNRNWTLVQAIGDFSYCTSSAIAVLCYGEVSLYRGTTQVSTDSDLSFGMVVVRSPIDEPPSKPQYVPYPAIDDRGFRVICRELGYEGDTTTAYDLSVSQMTDLYKIKDSFEKGSKKYKCAGDEHKLSDCPTEDFSGESKYPAIVQCTKAKEKNGTFRITSNNMIEVLHKNTWGLTCTDGRFTEALCKSMGFNHYRHYFKEEYSLNVADRTKLQCIWIGSSHCPNSNLADCQLFYIHSPVSFDCNVAFARCYNDEPTYVFSELSAYRELGQHFILRTKGQMNGILLIDSDDAAQFICNQLNYTYGRNYEISVSSKRIPQGFETNYWKATYNSQHALCKDKSQQKTLVDDCYEDDWDLVSDSGKMPLVNYMTVCYNIVFLEGNGYSGLVSYMYNSPKLDIAYINKDSISQPEVDLICKHIGFRNGGSIYNGYISKQHEFDHYDIVCATGSQRLEDCTFTKNPTAVSAVAVKCNLDGKPMPKYILDKDGIVHINMDVPSRVCANSQWNFNTTQKFCNSLGFNLGSSFSRRQDDFTNPVGYASVHCNGNEDDFDHCEKTAVTPGSQPCQNVVAVTCYDFENVIDNIRLVDGGNRFGNVKVNKSGSELYYCPDTFTHDHASTICRHLGFTSGESIKMDPITGDKAKWWKLTNSKCTDTTNRLEACYGENWPLHALSYDNECRTKAASVYCYSKVKFENGPYLNYGLIQETITQRRYSNKTFGDTEAKVACREMGFPLGGRVFPVTDSIYKANGTPITVKCKGDEKSLLDCYKPSGKVDKRFLAAVVCETGYIVPDDGTFKIDYDSRILVAKDGIWFALCPYNWMDNGETTATKICQQRGSGSGKPNLKHKSLLMTYATCFTYNIAVGEKLGCTYTYLDSDDHDFCTSNVAVFCEEETLEVSSIQYPRPVEGKDTRSGARKSISSPALLLTAVIYFMLLI